MEVTYPCDPNLNTTCSKKACYLSGGPCKLTKHVAFAKLPLETAFLTIPMSDEEYAEIAQQTPTALSIVGSNRKNRRKKDNAKKN